MVSYGHRLFCDIEDAQLRFRWGNAVVYRQYFQDYQAFVSRPQDVVDAVFGEQTDWAVVYADLSQFYDRVRPEALANKIEAILSANADPNFLAHFRSFFRWGWHSSDGIKALQYAEKAKPEIQSFDEVAIPFGASCKRFFRQRLFA